MVGIIILNYNSADDTIKCVDSIEKLTKISYQIYIVDGASTDNSYNMLIQYYKGNGKIKIIKSDINRGYSYGNNLGISEAIKDKADAILIINPDVILMNNAIDVMYRSLRRNSDVAIVGPKIISQENNEMQFGAKRLTFSIFILNRKPFIYLFKKRFNALRFYKLDLTNNKFMGSVSGCCFIINTSDFIKINLFDENIFLYHEEDILAYKLYNIQKRSMIDLNSKIIHNHSSTVNKESQAFLRFHKSTSINYVLRKYVNITIIQSILAFIIIVLPFLILAFFFKSYRSFTLPLIKNLIYLK